jgi:FkbM family methyltransferase
MVVSETNIAAHRPISRKKKFRLARKLARAGDPIGAVKWLVASLIGHRSPVHVVIRGHSIKLRPSSNDLSIALETLCGEFNEVFERVPSLKHGLIVDAGGYIGTAAIAFAAAYPEANVVTIEPSPENFALLVANTAAYPNIRPLNKALGGEPGSIELKDRGLGHAGLTIVERPDDNMTSTVLGSVEVTTIQQILEDFGCQAIDIAKIDIEGGELELLSSNLGWLDVTTAVAIELHDRIASGCSEAWEKATAGRVNSKLEGEKYLSVAA